MPNGSATTATTNAQNHVTHASAAAADKSRAEVGPRAPNRAVQHGAALTLSDHERLRVFTHEFMVRGLIAWAEKNIRTLSEQVRRGIPWHFLAFLGISWHSLAFLGIS